MFTAWGHIVYRVRWLVLAVSVLLLIASGFTAVQGGDLESGGFIETAESGRGTKLLNKELPSATNFTVIFSNGSLAWDDPRFRSAVEAAIAPLKGDPRVVSFVTPYDPTVPDPTALHSRSGHDVSVTVNLKDELAIARDYYPELRGKITSDTLQVQATGVPAINHGFNVILEKDLVRAETVSLPLAAILLLIVFGTVVAALIPLGVGILAVMGGVAGMFLLSRTQTVSVYAENVVTLIGLGVAIDYSLFVANRFREELHRGRSVDDAIAIAIATSGRAITFSGLTVAIGLSGMLFYEGTYLSSMGIAGAIVVASAVFYGLTFLPALLAVIGRRIDAIKIPILAGDPTGRGAWHAIAMAVMKRPIMVLLPLVALILLMGSPFLDLRLALGDVNMLPKHEESRAAYEKLTAEFPGAGQNHVEVIVNYAGGQPLAADHIPQLVEFQKQLAAVPRVEKVNSPVSLDPRLGAAEYTALYTVPAAQRPPQLQALVGAVGEARLAALLKQTVGEHIVLFDVVTNERFGSDDARNTVKAFRAIAPPAGSETLVTGFSAIDLDTVSFIIGQTPIAVGYIMIATMIVLFFLLGSVVLPLKAVIMNLLSISASFGALVWVFQEGHLSEQLGFVATGSIDPTLPVIMFCTIFGLSMDYEVLLLSRIQEEYRRLGDNTAAVAEGLQRSGRLITGAAAIMVIVFSAFGLAEILIIKAIGLGMALAVAIDATIVRTLVVPATMRLLGRVNWWAPGPLRWLYRRLGLGEQATPAVETV
ncbi:MAG TPA: MMPL family transporter [Candidatus Limnocylindria bacterium]|nr:MMPL family transporter [Candidatus Limnocylindria bacterium]